MSEAGIDYKQKYQSLKKKLKFLVYEQECYAEELKKSQRKLLKLSREKSFLLDQLMQYEQPLCESSDSEATQSSESEQETSKKIVKKRKIPTNLLNKSSLGGTSKLSIKSIKKINNPNNTNSSTNDTKTPLTKMTSAKTQNPALIISPTQKHSASLMTREDIERHLEMKHSNSKNRFLNINVDTQKPPDDIFSDDNSYQESSEAAMTLAIQNEDDSDLVIDMA